MMKLLKFLNHTISLDEFRVSTLVIGYLAILISSIIAYFLYGDISNNMLSLVESSIYAIAGVNAVNGVASIVERRNTRNTSSYSNEADESPEEEFKI